MITFKQRLSQGRPLLGLWQALANAYTAEISAQAGFDWLLFDGEHAPNTVQTMLAQLQATAPYPVEAIARLPCAEPIVIKHYLDIGFKTLLAPMIETAEQARMVVGASRFPPRGFRGVASSTSRASGFGADRQYLAEAHERLTLIAQIESRAALGAVDEIASVDGIDALFIGPADLAASLGYLGNPAADEVGMAIGRIMQAARSAGKPIGIFALSPQDAKNKIAAGFDFVSIGSDIGLLSAGAANLRRSVLEVDG